VLASSSKRVARLNRIMGEWSIGESRLTRLAHTAARVATALARPRNDGRDFEHRVAPLTPMLHRVARRLTQREEDAEDLVQQTLIRAYRAWARFDGEFLRSWLIAILRNEHRNHQRTRARQPAEVELNDDEPTADLFWNEALWRMEADRLLVELKNLPEAYRIAIQLCDVEEFSYAEAAQALDLPVGTIRSRLNRGRIMLRRLLDPTPGASHD